MGNNVVTHPSAEERALDLPASSASTAEAFATLGRALAEGVRTGDDTSLEIDGSPDRLRVRFRSVRHRTR